MSERGDDPKRHEHLFIEQLRKHAGLNAEVRLYVDGKLVSGTWPYQVTRSIDEMVEAAKLEPMVGGADE